MSATVSARVADRVIPWLLPAALLILWELSSQAGWLSPRILPSPLRVWQATLGVIESGVLWENLAASGLRAATGFVIGAGLGFACALVNGLFPVAGNALNPTLQVLRSIPSLGILPLLILVFGFGETTKLTIIALGSFVPIYLNTYAGIRLTDPGLLELARSQRLSHWQTLRDIILPAALPQIFTGLRFSAGVAWITLIVAESFSVDPGIGYMARHARERNLTEIVILSILVYAALGKLTDLSVRIAETRAMPWHPKFARKRAPAR